MIKKLKEIKDFIVGGLIALISIFAYFKGREDMRNKQMKEELNAIKKVKKARDNLADKSFVDKLHDRYKR